MISFIVGMSHDWDVGGILVTIPELVTGNGHPLTFHANDHDSAVAMATSIVLDRLHEIDQSIPDRLVCDRYELMYPTVNYWATITS